MTEPLPEQESASKAEKRMWVDRLGEILLPVLRAIVASYLTWEVRALRIGDVVEARDINNRWYLASITEIEGLTLRVHFFGWDSAYDEWISQFCSRHRRIGSISSGDCLESESCHCLLSIRIREPNQLCFFSLRIGPGVTINDEIIVDGRPAIVQSFIRVDGFYAYRVAFRDGHIASCRSATLPCAVPCPDSHLMPV